MKSPSQNTIEHQNQQVLEEVIKNVKSLKFGQLTITIHQGRIVQVDVMEKRRFDKLSLHEYGSGI